MPQFDPCSQSASGSLDGSETITACQGGNPVGIPLSDIVAFTIQTLLTSGAVDFQGGSVTVSGGSLDASGGPINASGGAVNTPNQDPFVAGDGQTVGDWRLIREGNNLVVQRADTSAPVLTWVTKHTFSA